MCELLALNFNQPINPTFSFLGLLAESDYHAHGWGLSYYPDDGNSAAIFKEAVSGRDSQLAQFLTQYEMSSKIFISHIRRSSVGRLSHQNTHPFSRCFAGTEWTFSHNGTLHDYPGKLQGMSYWPLGSTDSEYAFCKLLSQMKRRKIRPSIKKGIRSYTQKQFADIHDILLEINDLGDGAFNCIISDSQHLFCYRDISGARELHYLKRQHPFATTRLRNFELDVDLNLMKNDSEVGHIVSTEPLTDESWKSFDHGQLIVFKNGEIVADLF